MSDVYRTVRREFAVKAAREFRPRWLGVVPNLIAQQATKLEQLSIIPPRLEHHHLKPLTVILRVTSHCNYRCTFCHVNDLVTDANGSDAMSLEEFKEIFSKPLLSGVVRLGLTGGEPFLVPHLFGMVEEAKKRIPIVTVNTNFSLIVKNLDALNESALDMLSVSLYEPNHNQIKKYSTAIKPSIHRRLTFMVNELDNFHSFKRVPEIAQMAVDLGYRSLHFQGYEPYVESLDVNTPRSENRDSNRPIAETNSEFLSIKAQTERQFGDRIAIAWPPLSYRPSANERPRCNQPDKQITIDRDGNLAPCCSVDANAKYGNIHRQETWNSQFFQEIRRGLKVPGAPLAVTCRNCPFLYKDPYDA